MTCRRPLLALLVVAAAQLTAQTPCPLEGSARSPAVRALNVLKNRTADVTEADIDPRATLAALLAPGPDLARWNEARGARIVGYVRGVRPGGVETVNCGARDLPNRDTHIEVVLSPVAAYDESQMLVLEVTPRVRALAAAQRGEDWSTAALRKALLGRTVEFTGWIMLDREHTDAALNTARPGARVWRRTAVEIHPVTSIRVVTGGRPAG